MWFVVIPYVQKFFEKNMFLRIVVTKSLRHRPKRSPLPANQLAKVPKQGEDVQISYLKYQKIT